MADPRHTSHQVLRRIAEALGTDVTALSDERAGATAKLHQTVELLTAFEDIADLRDRRACLDFVRAMAEQRRNGSATKPMGSGASAPRHGDDEAAKDRAHALGSP